MLEPARAHGSLLQMRESSQQRVNPAGRTLVRYPGLFRAGISAWATHTLSVSPMPQWRARSGGGRIALCRDGRLSSPALERGLLEGLVAGGLQVCQLGLGPTPQMHFAIQAAALDGASW